MWDRSWVADTQQSLKAEINSQLSREIQNSISPRSYDDHDSLGSSTSRRSQSDQHEREHSQRDNKSCEEDNKESNSNGRDANKRKGEIPARHHRTPWDDDPSLSDSSSSSKSLSSLSSCSEDDWLDNLTSNKGLDGKAKRKLRRKAVQKLRAKTEDDDRRESWLKNILKEYKRQIRHYCDREPNLSTEMPRGIRIPNPSKFIGSNNVKEFDTWMISLLRWIVLTRLVGPDNDDQCVQVVGSYLEGEALHWYNDEVTGLHCAKRTWTFEEVILGLFTRFVQATTMHVASKISKPRPTTRRKGYRRIWLNFSVGD